MYKQFLYLALFFIFITNTSQAQDTLSLNIPERTAGILLKLNKSVIREENGEIHTSSTNWVLKTTSRKPGFKLSIINTVGNDSISITDLNRNYLIADNSLTASGKLNLKSNISLKIYNEADVLVKTYIITYKSTTGTANTDNDLVKAGVHYKPGSAVLDALFLAGPNNPDAMKYQILHFYAGNHLQPIPLETLYLGNRFLDSLAKKLSELNMGQSAGFLSSAFSSVGGLDVTNIADAFAKFLVKRTKQELGAAFFDRFTATLDSIHDLKALFPSTAMLMGVMGNEVYNYERYIQNLRQSFIQDISMLPVNFPGVIDNHPEFFIRHPELKAALLSACYVAGELSNQSHPGDILANYPLQHLEINNEPSASMQSIKASIQVVQLISQSLRDTGSREQASYWVNIRQVRELVNNRLALKYYLGLVLQEASNKFDSIHFEKNNNLIQQLNKVAAVYDKGTTVYNAFKIYVMRFAEKTDALNKMIANYKQPISDSSAMEKYQKYFRAAVDMIAYCTAISDLPIIKDIPAVQRISQTVEPYFGIAYATADMVIEINKRNYTSAINHAIYIYNEVKAKPAKADIVASVYEAGITNMQTSGRFTKSKTVPRNDFQKTLNLLTRYGSFMSVLASAKTSEEAEQAIEAFALPPGSSRVKRETLFNVALNAYAGLYTGYERIKGVDKSFKVNSYGVTAPLGVSISKGRSMFFFPTNTRSSSSIFMSFVDIGAVTAFRFTNDEAEKIPTIQLKHIISPGIFYSFGLGKTPLSANIGYQAGPLLRKVRLAENAYEKKYSRFSISLCVDIPVLNFYTRSE